MSNKPEFLKVGAIVKVQHWHGQISDIAVSEAGRVMVLITSPKSIWRNHPAEWLEYQDGQITPSSLEESLKNIEVHREMIHGMLARLDVMEEEWKVRVI